MTQRLEDKLGTLRYNFDKEPHIFVNSEICKTCKLKPCILACPAGCFKTEDGKLIFQYEDCIECGTCKKVCPKGAVDWNYPRGTFGVSFTYG
jgi:ferredoxin like protein